MVNHSDAALHDFVVERFGDLRRSAFLMCGDWSQAGEAAERSLARLVAENRREDVTDPDAYVYSHLMGEFPRRPGRREHVFVAAGPVEADTGEQVRDVLLLDALNSLATSCRAVLVLRHFTGFGVQETADVLDLPDERVETYEAAGLAALEYLLAEDEVAS